MKLLLKWKTKIGTFFIAQSTDGGFYQVFNDGDLGSYIRMVHAFEDLANNASCAVLHPETSELVDTSALVIPEARQEWNKV